MNAEIVVVGDIGGDDDKAILTMLANEGLVPFYALRI